MVTVKQQVVILGFVEAEEYMTAHAVLMHPETRVLALISACGDEIDAIDKTLSGTVDCDECLERLKELF